MDALFNNIDQIIRSNPVLAFPAVFAAGVFVSFSPCVYPVIPITLGVIGAKSAGSRSRGFFLSLVYVLGMALVYAALGAFASLTGKLFGQIGSSPFTYFLVANACLLFGLSLLGVFEFPQLRLRGASGKPAGFLGVFLLGGLAGLIVGPCTAPVLASVLVFVGSRQNLLYGFSLLFVFGYGVGFLFILLGTFAGLITSMPRSGAWLGRIQKGFGWFLIAVAEYLLIKTGGYLI